MKIDFNKSIKDLDGKPLTDDRGNMIEDTMAEQLSKMIKYSVSEKNVLKLYEMALQLKSTGILDLDTSDKEMLIQFIEESRMTTNLVKGQIIHHIKLFKPSQAKAEKLS